MSLIWKPADPERAPPKLIVSKGTAKSPVTPPSMLYEEMGAPRAASSRPRYGLVDTTFATVNMGPYALDAWAECGIPASHITRRVVPGFKDLAVAAKILIEEGCDIVVACGMVGPEPIDKQCGHEASLALAQAQLMTSTHILEVFVHMDEAGTDAELLSIVENRTREHAINAYWLLEKPEEMLARAGTGQRQGFADLGPADPSRATAEHLRPSSHGAKASH